MTWKEFVCLFRGHVFVWDFNKNIRGVCERCGVHQTGN